MNLYQYILNLLSVESRLMENFIKVAEYHKTEPGIYYGCQEMASISNDHIKLLRKESDLFHQDDNPEETDHLSLISDHKTGFNLDADLRFLWLLTMEAALLNNILLQASSEDAENDIELMCCNFERETENQSQWLMYRINVAARRSTVDA